MTSGYDGLFESIRELVMAHSPSGVEEEVDALLMERFRGCGHEPEMDAAGNLIVKIPGRGEGGPLAITAHKDEIGAIVTSLEPGGKVRVRRLGGAFPWIYGEGAVDLLGDVSRVTGVLSFGSRHVTHASPQHVQKETAPLRWQDAWIETKLSEQELVGAGVRPGTRMVVGKHRKTPIRLKDHIASYTLDNKASLAVLLELGRRVRRPAGDVFLIATSKEEVGSNGALFFAQREPLDALIALEIAPIAPEYTISDGERPVLLAEDGFGLYDELLNKIVRDAAERRSLTVQTAVVSNFGSDGSNTMRTGHVARAACLGFPTLNTHGFEIAHLGAIQNCVEILEEVCRHGLAVLQNPSSD